MKKLNSKVKLVWSIGYGIGFIAIVLAYILTLIFLPIEEQTPSNYSLIHGLFIPLIIIIGIIFLIYPTLKYKFYSYSYDDKTIRINKGIIFRKRIVVPVFQIQDLHLEQGPIMLMFKLASLEISTAGSNYYINGLLVSDCENMIEDLRLKLEKRVEENGYEKVQ